MPKTNKASATRAITQTVAVVITTTAGAAVSVLPAGNVLLAVSIAAGGAFVALILAGALWIAARYFA